LKRLLIALSSILVIACFFAGGIYTGYNLSEYDILCEKNYNPHLIGKPFKSDTGIIIPAGTVLSLRGCKPNTSARLEFYIDNWDYKHTKKLKKNPYPAIYLNTKKERGP